ncbi:hypothetical protein [Sphingomonas sp. ERG5]|nr:hypothetical protein [Sphingomonas sp. ERG5]
MNTAAIAPMLDGSRRDRLPFSGQRSGATSMDLSLVRGRPG